MKYIKIRGLLAVAVSALMAFAASASATTITSPTDTLYTKTIHAVSEKHVILHNPIAKIECESTIHVESLTHGPGVTAKGTASLIFFNCTNSWHVTVVNGGTLEIHNDTPGGGTYDGDLTGSGGTIETTRFGIACRYATSATSIGTLTGGSTATFHVNGAVPFHSGSGLCGSGPTTVTGGYTVKTSASGLFVDHT